LSLQKQDLPVKIGSLDTLTDLRQLPLGALTLLENMVREKAGALQKRYGADAQITALAASSNRRLVPFGDELLAFTAAATGEVSVGSYSSARTRWTTANATFPKFFNCLPAIRDVYASASAQTCHDVAVNGNYSLSAWEDSSTANTVLFRVTDLTTGTVLFDSSVSSAAKPKCIAVGTVLLLFHCSTAATNLIVRRISISGAGALSVASTTTIATNIHANHSYDVQARADQTRVAIAYHSTVPDVRLVDWNPSTDTATTSTTVAGQLADRCVGWLAQDWNTTNAYVAIADSANGVKYLSVVRSSFAFGAATLVDAAKTDIRNITGYYDGTNVQPYFEENSAIATYYNLVFGVLGGASARVETGCGIASKMFKIATGFYAMVLTYDSPTQKTYFVWTVDASVTVSTAPVEPAARMLWGNGGGLTAKRSALSGVSVYGSLFVTGLLRATRLDTQGGAFVVQTNPVLCTMDFTAASAVPYAKELGGTLFVSGGILRSYDLKTHIGNLRLSEAAALLSPEPMTLLQGAGGSLTALGVYKYKSLYCTVDNRGRIRRSPPSESTAFTLTGANNKLNVNIPYLRTTSIPYSLEYYRTVAGGDAYYRVLAFGAIARDGAPLAGTNYIADDTLDDATLETQEPLYTDSGELPNHAPPPFRHIEVHKARLWGISAEDDHEVWYSKEILPGAGIGFHPDFKLRLEGDDGGAYALASMDDKLIAFKRNSIYVTTGDGPDNRGQGNAFPPFTLVSRNVGTVEPSSVLLTPDGVMFKSQKGIYLLTRALEVVYIGAAVDAYNSLTITAAVLVDGQSQARYTTSSGRTLVYDYAWKEWFTFTNQAAVSAANWGNKFTYVLSDGTILQEAAGTYSDNGAAITQAIEFAPIASAGSGGWQRAYELRMEGDYFASSTFTLKLAYDFESTNTETLSKALASIQVDSTYRCRAKPARRNCEAIRPRIEESSTGQGFAVSALMLIVGVAGGKGGRIPAANAAT
jgi:hypothetical protein